MNAYFWTAACYPILPHPYLPGCVGLCRGRRDVEVLQRTAAPPGWSAQGAGGCGHAAAGALWENWLCVSARVCVCWGVCVGGGGVSMKDSPDRKERRKEGTVTESDTLKNLDWSQSSHGGHLLDSGCTAEPLTREMSSIQYISRGLQFTLVMGALVLVEGIVVEAPAVSETRWEQADCSSITCFLAPKRRQEDHFHSVSVPFRQPKRRRILHPNCSCRGQRCPLGEYETQEK